jgi:hypothetical protein
VKVTIVYDADGTAELAVEAERVTSQLWGGGRTLVRLINGGKVTRTIQFRRAHLIDIGHEPVGGAGSGVEP